jgi:hypothetical protein
MKLRKPAYFPYGESPMNVSVVGLPVMRSRVVAGWQVLFGGLAAVRAALSRKPSNS